MSNTNIWKLHKLTKKKYITIKEFIDVLASDLMNTVMKATVSSDSVATSIKITNTTINVMRRI